MIPSTKIAKLTKHSFEQSCCLRNKDDLAQHVANIIEFSGCMDIPCTCFAVREWIPGDCAWVSEVFSNMPVRKEFRFFVEGGKISHVQPYWPEEAFAEYEENEVDWREKLARISEISRHGYTDLAEKSLRIAAELGGNWSVDWLWSDRGWVLTDMAVANRSYRYQPKKNFREMYDNGEFA